MDFGYACISTLVKDSSPAKTVTVKRLTSFDDPGARLEILRRILKTNLDNTLRLLWHNIAHGIRLYRLTSQIAPLATHSLAEEWDWRSEFKDQFHQVGEVMHRHRLRISSHPGTHTVLNSPTERVVQGAIAELNYHNQIFEAFGLDHRARMVLHVGGAQGSKADGLRRFRENFPRLPEACRRRLLIENDDTLYTAEEVLGLCQAIGVPMVLDIHHDAVNPSATALADLVPAIFATWPPDEKPKIHVSSPASDKEPKAHADYVNPGDFTAFLKLTAGHDFDVMIEAKKKDAAVLRLWEDIGFTPPDLRAEAEAEMR